MAPAQKDTSQEKHIYREMNAKGFYMLLESIARRTVSPSQLELHDQ